MEICNLIGKIKLIELFLYKNIWLGDQDGFDLRFNKSRFISIQFHGKKLNKQNMYFLKPNRT